MQSTQFVTLLDVTGFKTNIDPVHVASLKRLFAVEPLDDKKAKRLGKLSALVLRYLKPHPILQHVVFYANGQCEFIVDASFPVEMEQLKEAVLGSDVPFVLSGAYESGGQSLIPPQMHVFLRDCAVSASEVDPHIGNRHRKISFKVSSPAFNGSLCVAASIGDYSYVPLMNFIGELDSVYKVLCERVGEVKATELFNRLKDLFNRFKKELESGGYTLEFVMAERNFNGYFGHWKLKFRAHSFNADSLVYVMSMVKDIRYQATAVLPFRR